MDEKKFTIFFNSRGRVKQLHSCICTIAEKTKNHNDLEMIVKGDEDDFQTQAYLENVEVPFRFGHIIGPRPYSLNASINEIALMANGRYLFHINDDAEIETQDWDELAFEKIQDFRARHNLEDDIIYGWVEDNSADKDREQNYASFPIVSKEAVKVLGMYFPAVFLSHGPDPYIYRIYEAVDRVVDLREITLNHVFHRTINDVMNPDQTNAEVRQRAAQYNINPQTMSIDEYVDKLEKHIDECSICN